MSARGRDEAAARGADVQKVAQPPRRRRLRLLLLGLGPVLFLVGAAAIWLFSGRYVSTDDAYVRAGMTQVSSDVSGRVVQVAVRENQRVSAGDLLVRLDDEPFRYAVARAEAQLARTRLLVEGLRATYAQRAAELRRAREAVDYYARELERQNMLLASRVASQAKFDDAKHQHDAARQSLDVAQQALANALAALGGDPGIETARHPEVRAAQAALDQALLDLNHVELRAATGGIVARVDRLQRGSYVTAGTPLFALMGADDLWVEANFKETDLTHVRPGQRATVTVDAFPDASLTGIVEGISPGTGAEFSVLPAQNASGNWVKVVQRLPLRIRLDPVDADLPLRSGMSVWVEVDTGRQRSLAGLVGGALARGPASAPAPSPASSPAPSK